MVKQPFCALAQRRCFFLTLLFFCFSVTPFATTSFCQLSALNPQEHSLKINCVISDLPVGKLELRFLDRFASLDRMSERVFGLQIKDAAGQRVLPEISGSGVYRLMPPANTASLTLEYEMRLARVAGAASDPSRYALTSSLSQDAGFLLLADILPSVCAANQLACTAPQVRMKLQLPEAWQVVTTEPESFGAFDVADVARAVFFVGKLRTQTIKIAQMTLQVALAESIPLTEEQILPLVAAIAREQSVAIGSREQGNYLVTLAPFPVPLTGLRSSALTRGRSIVMLLNPDASEDGEQRTLTLYRKHLAHELFHFYLPEAFVARENFDWFWEGFTRYVALLTLNQLQAIRFREYLDEIGFEFTSYHANPLRSRLSLLDASQGKFASVNSYELLYRKGTLVAALYDLELRAQSNGKKSVLDVMRELYANYRQRELGNREILATLRNTGKFDAFVRDYIEGTRGIDLPALVKAAGLSVEQNAGRPRLIVAKKISSQQNALLAALGY